MALTLAERIKLALAKSGLSQAELARRAGIAQPSVNGWVSGATKSMRANVAVKAARALGVRTEWLANGTGPMVDEYVEAKELSSSQPMTPHLATAAAVFLDALRACPHKEELRVLLPLLVETDAPLYRARLLELLGAQPTEALPVESRDFYPPVPSADMRREKA